MCVQSVYTKMPFIANISTYIYKPISSLNNIYWELKNYGKRKQNRVTFQLIYCVIMNLILICPLEIYFDFIQILRNSKKKTVEVQQ